MNFNASPYEALPPLLANERGNLPRRLWEPACGNGALVLPLRNRGYTVRATDIVDRGCPDSGVSDFLLETERFDGGIITNPPFDSPTGDGVDFVRRATALAPYVAILHRTLWIESKDRIDWWPTAGLARIIVIADRLPMFHREAWDGKKLDKSPTCYAWFIFEHCAIGRKKFDIIPRLWARDIQKFPPSSADFPTGSGTVEPPLLNIMRAT